MQGYQLEVSSAKVLPMMLICTYATTHSHLIFEHVPPDSDASVASTGSNGLKWAVVPLERLRVTIDVREHGSERLFVAANTDVGSALPTSCLGHSPRCSTLRSRGLMPRNALTVLLLSCLPQSSASNDHVPAEHLCCG